MTATFAVLQNQILARMEDLENEIQALHCVTGLLRGQEPGSHPVNMNELAYLIDPIVDREKAILEEVRDMFKTVGFTARM